MSTADLDLQILCILIFTRSTIKVFINIYTKIKQLENWLSNRSSVLGVLLFIEYLIDIDD